MINPMENRLDTELIKSRFAELSGVCNELERLVTGPQHPRSELQVALIRLKNQLRLIEVATSGQGLELSMIRRFKITPEELYILTFANKDRFLNKALKGDTKSIIECTSAIKSSISFWETRILQHLDSKANGNEEGKQQVVRPAGKQLRRRILQYLLDRDHVKGSSLPGLDEIARDLGVGKSDVDDQIDILDSLGAIKANRTFGDAAPMLTGTGKALLEELEQESLSTRESRYALGVSGVKSGDDTFEWDVFISHATEDKDVFVRQLAKELGSKSLHVWYDEFTLRVGDSLRQSIEKGLAKSRYGIVVLSSNFFAKKWPQDELNGLAVRERRGEKVILPVWLNVDENYIASYSLILADRIAAKASDGMAKVISDLLVVISPCENHSDTAAASAVVLPEKPSIVQTELGENHSENYRRPTIFFYDRIAESFPGIRGLYETTDIDEVISRLNIVHRNPLRFEGYYPPLMMFNIRGGTLDIDHFRVLNEDHILIVHDELRPKKLAVFRPESYWQYFIYLECQPDSPTGLCENVGEYEEYAIYQNELITRPEYDDGCIFRNGKSISLRHAELRARALIPTNLIIASRFSPMNINAFDKERRSILKGILKGSAPLSDFVDAFKQLPRHPKDC